jgi:O-antigen/teichoic acid export membrane protein
MATYTRRAARGTFFVAISLVTASLFAYLMRILLARNLSIDSYGLFYSVWVLIIFASMIADLGISSAITKYIAKYRAEKKYSRIKTATASAFAIVIVSSLTVILLVFMLSGNLAEWYFKNSSAVFILNILLVFIFLNAVYNVMKAVFRGFQKMLVFSVMEPLKNLAVFVFAFLLFKINLDLLSAPLSYIISTALGILVFGGSLGKIFRFSRYRIASFSSEARKLVLFGIPVILTGFGEIVIGNIDTIMLTYFRTLAEVAVYNVVLPTALIFLFFGGALSIVALPMASELWAKKEKKKIRDGLRLLYKYSFLAMIPAIGIVFEFSEFAIALLFGNQYVSGYLSFQILLAGVFLYVVAYINNTVIVGIGKPGEITKIILIASVLNIVLNAALIPVWGIVGAALATSLSYFLILVLSLLKVKKYVGIKLPLLIWLKTLIVGAIFLLTVHYARTFFAYSWIQILLSSAAGLAAYIALIFILKLIDTKEISRYTHLIRK